MRPGEPVRKQGNPAVAGLLCLTGATGLEPATSGVTGDPTGFGWSAEVQEIPGQQRFSIGSVEEPKRAPEGDFGTAWTRCGRVEIELRSRAGEVEATLVGYPLRET